MNYQLIETHNNLIQVSDFETYEELLAHKQMRIEASPDSIFEEKNTAQQKINAEALAYLASTDWMVVREVETQVPCPLEVKQLRAEARLRVVR
jgi:hypothetical protein